MYLTTVVINLTSRDKVFSMYGWRGSLMVSAVVSGTSGLGSSPAGDIVLCSLERHFTLTHSVSLHPDVYRRS